MSTSVAKISPTSWRHMADLSLSRLQPLSAVLALVRSPPDRRPRVLRDWLVTIGAKFSLREHSPKSPASVKEGQRPSSRKPRCEHHGLDPWILACEAVLVPFPTSQEAIFVDPLLERRADRVGEEYLADR